MRKFKRATHTHLTGIICLLSLICMVKFMVEMVRSEYTVTPTSITLIVGMIILVIVFALVDSFVAKDFDYTVHVRNGLVLFTKGEKTWQISRFFTIIKKDRNYLTLSDGKTQLRIAYNKDVLDFLNKVQYKNSKTLGCQKWRPSYFFI